DTLDGATAFVVCAGPPSTGTGPTSATFARYASLDDMNSTFTSLADVEGIPGTTGTIQECAEPASVRAVFSRQGGGLGGQVACFTETDTGTSYLFWTDEAALAIGYVAESSGDAGALYDWWNSVDFVADR
ncbi:hypothetical protein I4I77_27475, partial [Pseudonocardia sp. KRD-188]